MSFTKLAELRKTIWDKLKDPNYLEIEKLYSDFIEYYSNRKKIKRRYPKEPPTFDMDLISEEKLKKIHEFYLDNGYKIECVRTHLFMLHHISQSVSGIGGLKDIELCDKIFDGIHDSCTLLSEMEELLEKYLRVWADGVGLEITADWLHLWFGLEFIRKKEEWLKKIDKERLSPNGRTRFYVHFSSFYLYLLHIMNTLGYPTQKTFWDIKDGYIGFMDGGLFLLSEYAHHVEGLPVNIPLYRIMTDAWDTEGVLYTVREGYRDHLHHVWNVCLLGMVLIEAGMMDILDPDFKRSSPDGKKKRRMNWILAGLCHDIGYALDLNSHLVRRLKPIRSFESLEKFLKGLQSSFREHEKALCEEFEKKFNFGKSGKLSGKLDHGVTSAMILLHMENAEDGERTDKIPSKEWIYLIDESFEAIGKHNLSEMEIDPKQSPLALLLLICDHLQEWDRPRIESSRFGRTISSLLLQNRGMPPQTNTVVNKLKSNLVWKNVGGINKAIINKTFLMTLEYKDAAKERFEPAVIWCQNCHDLEKINFKNWPAAFTMTLSSEHKLSSDLAKPRKFLELDLFEDFVRDRGNDRYLHLLLLIDAAKKDKYGISYDITEETIETFSFTLKNMTDKKLLAKYIPNGIYGDFMTWKEKKLRSARQS